MRCAAVPVVFFLACTPLLHAQGWSGTGATTATEPASRPAVDYSKDTGPRSAFYRVFHAIETGDEKLFNEAMIITDPSNRDVAEEFVLRELLKRKLFLACEKILGDKVYALNLDPELHYETTEHFMNLPVETNGDKATIKDESQAYFIVKKDGVWKIDFDASIGDTERISDSRRIKSKRYFAAIRALIADVEAQKYKTLEEIKGAYAVVESAAAATKTTAPATQP